MALCEDMRGPMQLDDAAAEEEERIDDLVMQASEMRNKRCPEPSVAGLRQKSAPGFLRRCACAATALSRPRAAASASMAAP